MDARKAEAPEPSVVSDREVLVTRLIQAPRELVWSAFTKPEVLAQWWGPNGFTITTKTFDFSVGGDWIFIMHGPDGRDYPNSIRFTEIVEPLCMAHDHGADDGKVAFQARITLDDLGARTQVTLRSTFPTKAARDHVVKEYGAIEGGNQTLARLDEYLQPH